MLKNRFKKTANKTAEQLTSAHSSPDATQRLAPPSPRSGVCLPLGAHAGNTGGKKGRSGRPRKVPVVLDEPVEIPENREENRVHSGFSSRENSDENSGESGFVRRENTVRNTVSAPDWRTSLERLRAGAEPRPEDDVLGGADDDAPYRPYGEADFAISGADSWNAMLASLDQRTADEARRANAMRKDLRNPLDDPNRKYWRSVTANTYGKLLTDREPLA
jgi:hypothetical protein